MDDLISRQMAIDALMNSEPGSWNNDDYERGEIARFREDITIIKNVPSVRRKRKSSAQPERLTDKEAEEYQRIIDRFMAFASAQLEPRWIPVEERLPREGQRVLVTDEDGGIDIAHFIDYSDFGEGIEWWVYDYKCNPIAWSELPTAYERSEDE